MFAPVVSFAAKILRESGKSLDRFGRMLEFSPVVEKRESAVRIVMFKFLSYCNPNHYPQSPFSDFIVNPSLRALKFKKVFPEMKGTFVASSATVIGNVSVGSNSGIWYNAILRG